MTAFAGLVDRLFADPNLGRDATWGPAEGEPVSVRVVARRADAVTEFGGARLWSETTRSTSVSRRWRARGRGTGSCRRRSLRHPGRAGAGPRAAGLDAGREAGMRAS